MILVVLFRFFYKEAVYLKIEANGEEKISVTLSKTDMTDFDITYDEMDYSNIETRRVIWTILDEAKKVLGKPINIDNRLLIQVSPADDGGCFLQFTQLPEAPDTKKKRLIMKKDAEPFLFRAFDRNAFIDGLSYLKRASHMLKESEPYKLQNQFYIIIHPKPTLTESIIFSLCEFGEILTSAKKDIAKIYETGTLLS